MNGHAAPYLDRCREMGFDELAGFIADCLDRMYDPDPSVERPHSPEEFRIVRELLCEKYEAIPPDPPPPPPSPDPLEVAYKKRARTMELLKSAYGDPKMKKKHITQMLETLDRLDREIEELQSQGRHVRFRPPPRIPGTPKRAAHGALYKILGDIERAFRPQPTRRIYWRPLPRGEATPESIRSHYRERLHHEGRLDKYNEGRLAQATALPYEDWWVPSEGFGGFDAYSIFTFAHTAKVLLECPIYENAAYVIDADEEVWREKTKQQLTDSGLAVKIPHQGENWPAKIRQALDLD